MFNLKISAAVVLATGVFAANALAHGGRRLEVKVIDDQLVAHGYISTGVDDQGGVIRPYFNALHDHWANNPADNITAATATLPGFDVFDEADALIGHSLTWTLDSVMVWNSPAMSGPITLDPLSGETLFVTRGGTISSDAPGSLSLLTNFDGSNGDDLDLAYNIAARPSGVIYVVKGHLSTSNNAIADSDTIYTILSPDPTPLSSQTYTMPERMANGLHHHALHAEAWFGTPVPEPAGLALLGLGGFALLMQRRRA